MHDVAHAARCAAAEPRLQARHVGWPVQMGQGLAEREAAHRRGWPVEHPVHARRRGEAQQVAHLWAAAYLP